MNNVSAPDHLRYKTVDAGYVLGVMKQAGNGLNIVILDACRDSPFKSFSRSMNRGLKRVSGVEGTIIAYSTSPGKVALDGNGRNSPYTKQLIKLMKTPDLPVEIMFKNVRKGVKLDTGGKQSPWYESSIDGDFYFLNENMGSSLDELNIPNQMESINQSDELMLQETEENELIQSDEATLSKTSKEEKKKKAELKLRKKYGEKYGKELDMLFGIDKE